MRHILVIAALLTGCATQKYRPMSPPSNTPPPQINKSALDTNIQALENTLHETKSRVDRINILINSLKTEGEPVK